MKIRSTSPYKALACENRNSGYAYRIAVEMLKIRVETVIMFTKFVVFILMF